MSIESDQNRLNSVDHESNPGSRRPSIFVVDDNDGFRESVAFMLGMTHYDIHQFDCAEKFLHSLDSLSALPRPCLLLDVRMPGLSGLDLHDRLNQLRPDMPVIYMTGHADVPLAVEAMKKGAVTLLEKPLEPVALGRAIDAALSEAERRAAVSVSVPGSVAGSAPGTVPGTVSGGLSSGSAATAAVPMENPTATEEAGVDQEMQSRLESLTPRENEVLELLLQGMANKQCAHEMHISVRTVELHRARLLKKVGVRSGAELIRVVLLHRAQA